jgi:hypothetical protein
MGDSLQLAMTKIRGLSSSMVKFWSQLHARGLISSRTEIDNSALIYGVDKWLKPDDCLWDCTVEISGKQPLDELYPGLRTFFVNHVRVMPMTPDVLAQELDKLSRRRSPDPHEARRILLALGQVLAASNQPTLSDKSLALLKKATCFPVTGPNGTRLASCYDDYCINDHKRYGDLFLKQIDMLDFDHENLTSLHALFQLLHMERFYLSSLVQATTTVENSRRNDVLTDHIRGLAYALSWSVCICLLYSIANELQLCHRQEKRQVPEQEH